MLPSLFASLGSNTSIAQFPSSLSVSNYITHNSALMPHMLSCMNESPSNSGAGINATGFHLAQFLIFTFAMNQFFD